MAHDELMVSVSGIRGRVGTSLTPEVVVRYAAAFGAWSIASGTSRTIVVGRDSRVSGPMFHRIVLGTLQSVGCTVMDLGLTTTPTCQLAVEHHHAAGGVMISASHNPIEWNALKFVGPSGMFLDGAESERMRAGVSSGVAYATWDRLGGIEQDERAVLRHIERILALPYVDQERIAHRRFKIALDCCRGAGAVIMPALLERLGCVVSIMNGEPDGRFPRPPEPVAENLGELEQFVKRTGADAGFAVDPDVDRLAIVSDEGKAIGEDYTLALATQLVLRHRKGPVVTNLSTSRVVEDAAVRGGSALIRSPVGEINVAIRMRDVQAVVGGEGNGGVILPELHLGRDAPLGAALVLQLLAEDGRSLAAITRDLPRYVIVKDKMDRPRANLDVVYGALRAAFPDAEADMQDGLRLSWSDRWVHVRPSGTEPIVRVIAEAPTAEAAADLVRRSRVPLDALKG
jgi:phosphomannomutase